MAVRGAEVEVVSGDELPQVHVEHSPAVEHDADDPGGGLLEQGAPGGVPRPPEERLGAVLAESEALTRDRYPIRRAERVAGEEYLGDSAQARERDLGAGDGIPQNEPRGRPDVVDQREPATRRTAAVGEPGRRGAHPHHPLLAEAAGEPGGVSRVAGRGQRAGAGHDPGAERGQGRGAGSPVGADLADVEAVGVGGQAAGDLLEEIAWEGGPAGAAGRRDAETFHRCLLRTLPSRSRFRL